jgi:hypothetical protein
MARPTKRKVPGGGDPRGGTSSKRVTERQGRHQAPESRRYTPPVPPSVKVSAPWVPYAVFTQLGLGLVVIVFNYVGWMPASPANWYLVLGLAFILGGILAATRWH